MLTRLGGRSNPLLQLAVLVFQCPQPLGFRHIQAAVLGLPVVQGCFRDPVLARQIGRLCSSLVLAQHPDDLLLCEPDTLHRPSLQQGRSSNPPWTKNSVAGHMDEISGCSPYGASTITKPDGSRMPSENELAGARFQGRHVAQIASKLKT